MWLRQQAQECEARILRMNVVGWMLKEHPTVQVEYLPLYTDSCDSVPNIASNKA